ncbi:hepatic and glial cell adhesion molecule-like isoform X2 [Neoarius graeffei]|nr:hepatic and glial cell adhesion molecule-like isoform X2 [Neoarius graeffei]
MICALEASSVTLTCSYSNTNITTGFWFRLKDKAKWRKEEHPEDLALDSDYAGRVSYSKLTNFSLTLTITDLRKRDSGKYDLMFITNKGEKYLSSAGINLTVTDLQVSHDSTRQALTCRTSCLLTPASHRYHWYKNGQYLKKYTANMQPFHVSNDDEGRYSCSFQGYNEIFSPPLCVGRKCWNVTYPEKRVCALEGSSVELAGSYSHPSDLSVSKVIWYDVLSSKVYQDLRQETQFTNRAEYVQQDRNFNLKMNQLTKKDSGEYRLRFYTNNDKGLSGRPGVVLKVTDLQVRVSESAVESVTLSCITSCTLSNNPTYLWYKNGQPVTNKPTKHNKLYLISSEDAGTYSCAVTGREDLRSPEQTVTRGDESSVEVWKLHALWGAVALVPGLFLSLLITVLCMKRKRGAKRDTDVQIVPSPGDDTYTELNSRTMSPDYDILQNVQSSASGTYTTLNPATMSSDYDTLRY